ncbi:MAG: carbohydrate kinase [Anaerolineae bacterium]|nr:carbohydrate kinase [Anaerolineae bacterium]NUQ05360.1 carbohydrate kinase [Anaerolineae bacterium]
MTRRCILTVDCGTSSTKTALWDETGETLAEASAAYRVERPDPLWAEIDAEAWWRALCSTARDVLARSGVRADEVAGIGVDGVGWTLLPVDRACKPLTPAMIWLDRRGEAETEALRGLSQAEALVNLAANPLDAAYITPKLRWLQAHHPAIFDAAHQFLTCSGFLTARLTGVFTCDYTQAYGYHCFDMRNARWDEAAAHLLDIPLEKLPPLHAPTDVVGVLMPSAAQEIGLNPGVPVIAGCLDAASGALGAGVTRLGQTNEQGGQAGGFAVSLDRVVVEPQLIFSHHVLPGQYLLQAGTVGGGSLGWFRDVFGQIEVDAAALLGVSPFELLSAQAKAAPPGANGVIWLPYMAGERTPLWSSTARGALFGMSYATTRADVLRAIMEGAAFAVYDNMRLAAEKGVTISECLGSGGATSSAVWCQIKADIYGVPLIVARRTDEGEGGHSLGMFALTACGVGLRDDIGAAVERLLPSRQVYEPAPERHALYEEMFAIYRRVSRKLLDDFADLRALIVRG